MTLLAKLLFLGITSVSSFASGLSAPRASVQALLSANQDQIASLRNIALSISSDAAVAPTNDVFYLRYALETSYENDDERIDALKSNIQWRLTDGKDIVTNAHRAVQAATSEGNSKWNNQPAQQAAPHADRINKYLTSVQCITTSHPSTNDLIYCVRAGKIDDKALMSSVTVDEMIDFFLYVKEVNAAVADMRSLETDSLIKIVTCNDLIGVKLVGGSSDFRSALSLSSKKATELYPSLSGRTLLLNLPALLGALVKLFTPLFPAAVMERIRFERGPLKNVEDLMQIVESGAARDEFIKQMDELVYSD
ncbi:hypothetical protein ACHAXM_002568 [Skeletonema potamos]|jgi:hypothetical protein